MSLLQVEQAALPDFPPAPDAGEEGDPTWNADGIEDWSSSTDDDEESVMELDQMPPVFDSRDPQAVAIASANTVPSDQAAAPKLSLFKGIVETQKRWLDMDMKTEPVGRSPAQSSESDGSLASIPSMVPRIKETPIPLPQPIARSISATQLSRPNIPGSSLHQINLPESRQPVATLERQNVAPAAVTMPFGILTNNGNRVPSSSQHQATTPVALPATAAPVAIKMTKDGRNYGMYMGDNGQLISTRGVLIPEQYELHDDAEYPYICPVRDCRRILRTLFSLGGHFSATHMHTTVNDNGDGTFTQVGSYKNPSGSSPAIVVSRNPLPEGAPAAAPPRLPDTVLLARANASKRQLEEPRVTQANKRQTLPGNWKSAQYPPRPPLEQDALPYISGIHRDEQIPRRADVDTMLRMPMRRKLPGRFVDHHRGTSLGMSMWACATAYLVGEEVTGPTACRAATGPLARLSEKCIIMPTTPALEIVELSEPHARCVGCAYLALMTGQPDHCTLTAEGRVVGGSELRPGVRSSSVRPVPVVRSSTGPKPAQAQPEPSSSAKKYDVTLASRRPVRQSVLNRLQVDKAAAALMGTDEAPVPTATNSPSAQSPSNSTDPGRVPGVQPGQFGAPDYEMEDWEIAPGRVTTEDSLQNIAYSGAFLTSSTPITISPEVEFNVLTIRPGQIYKVPVQASCLQVFSVASGKVRITTGGKVVQLGPNGAFPVRPDERCVIENRVYFEAVVHCTLVKEYGLT